MELNQRKLPGPVPRKILSEVFLSKNIHVTHAYKIHFIDTIMITQNVSLGKTWEGKFKK